MEANMRKQPIPLDVFNIQRNNESYPKGSYFQNNSQQFQQQYQQPQQRILTPNDNNYSQNPYGIENVNQNLNQFVRNQLISRGVSLGKSPSPLHIRQQEQERKKVLLDNIQKQIALTQTVKHQEKINKKIEDDKYLQDMVNSFPFGRGGGGAPIRDKNGEIVATRRALISDPKYNLVSINVDDDYDDVWRKDKQYGLVNFKNKPFIQNTSNILNSMQRNLSEKLPGNFNWNQTVPMRGNNMQQMNQGQFQQHFDYNQPQQMYNDQMNYDYLPQNNMNNNNAYNDMNYNQGYQRQSRTPQPYPNQNQYMDFPQNTNYNQMNQNQNQYMEPQNNYNPPQYNSNNINKNNSNTQPYNPQVEAPSNNIEKAELNLSYDNYGLDEEKRQKSKEIYKNQLQDQMREKELHKMREKERKDREDREEEERINRENEEIQRRLDQERNKTQIQEVNADFINQYVVESKSKSKTQRETHLKSEEDANDRQKSKEQEALIQFNQQEIESRMQLNSEILKLRDQMQEQQVNLFNQINSLKSETQNANMQRFEALKEIDSLKNELSKQRSDESLRRKYVYDVILDDQSKVSNVYNQTHLPDTQTEKVVLTTKQPQEVYYEERIRHPNRIIPNPQFDELKESQMKGASKFIDLDSHKVFDGLELYEPKIYSEQDQTNFQQVNNKGYELNDDFNPLRSYYNESRQGENENRFSDDVDNDIQNNIGALNDNHLEINQIYNRNLERLRFLNDIDEKDRSKPVKGGELKGNSKVNFDDFINKLNKTCELHD